MSSYLLAGLVIVLANLIPAFAPPTWAILVYFSFGYHLHSIPLILIGVLSATMGRAVLALLFRALAPYLPRGYVTNLENLGSRITTDSRSAMGLFFLFFLSPISSAQLFEAAGIIKQIALRPLLIAFAIGRTVSYSIYVTGAQALHATSLGQLLFKELTSPLSIAVQITFILGLVALGNIKWKEQL